MPLARNEYISGYQEKYNSWVLLMKKGKFREPLTTPGYSLSSQAVRRFILLSGEVDKSLIINYVLREVRPL